MLIVIYLLSPRREQNIHSDTTSTGMASSLNSNEICKVCLKWVINKGVECDGPCRNWFHPECVRITPAEYKKIADGTNKSWTCDRTDCASHSTAGDPMQELNLKMTSLLNNFTTLATKVEIKAVSDGINDLKEELSALREEFVTFEPRLKATEDRLDAIEEKLSSGHNGALLSSNPEEVLRELNDRANRARNLMFYNLPEHSGINVKTRVAHDKELIVKLIQSVAPNLIQLGDIKLVRVGKPNKNKSRPLKVIFQSDADAQVLIKHFSQDTAIKTDRTFAGVTVSRDRTPGERDYLKKLRSELEMRNENGERGLTIKYRNGIPTIVSNNSKNV